MCTLSFFPSKNSLDFIVTSNRDESIERETIPPKIYREKGVELCFPKDKTAGGTWIGASARKRLTCLMNGGFKPHRRSEKYRMSRGLVVKELLLSEDHGEKFLTGFNLNGIEPFTIVNVEWSEKLRLLQLVWDGSKKHFEELPIKPRIWSASMLYSEETKREREKLFENFMKDNLPGINKHSKDKFLDFHRQFILDRGKLKTTSITQFIYGENKSEMRYEDLLDGEQYAVDSLNWQ